MKDEVKRGAIQAFLALQSSQRGKWDWLFNLSSGFVYAY